MALEEFIEKNKVSPELAVQMGVQWVILCDNPETAIYEALDDVFSRNWHNGYEEGIVDEQFYLDKIEALTDQLKKEKSK